MTTERIAGTAAKAAQEDPSKLLKQYGCGPIQFMGTDGLYERHLHFDNVIDEKLIGLRERFEAAARSIRDVLSQRWVLTEKTYEQKNPKRVYYLSMEFLLGRSLANNVTNLLLDPLVTQTGRRVGKRRIGTTGSMLPRLHGYDSASSNGLRPSIRIWHF